MTDIIILIIGVVAGLVAGGLLIYLLPYRILRDAHQRTQVEVTEAQAKNNELQVTMLQEQSKAYQARQALLSQQKRLEGDLTEARQQHAELERQFADLKAQQDQQQQAYLAEVKQLRVTIARLEQEQMALQDRFARESAEWDQERQNLLLSGTQIDDQTQQLRQEKVALETRLEQQHDAWERERLALQIQVNTLEDNLALQKARAGHALNALPPDSARLVEQVRSEASAELNQQRLAWQAERQALKEQVERLQAERQAPRDRAAAELAMELEEASPSGSGEQGLQDLRRELKQARQAHRNLEERFAVRVRQAEQERSALEGEIEQLMERLLRVQRERGG
jgi:chromosome segregation ATPase